MTISVFEDYHALSAHAASFIAGQLRIKPSLTLCMASGHTPALTVEMLVNTILSEKIDYSGFRFIGLDEWLGLPPENSGSCHYFFKTKLIDPLQLSPSQYFLFDAMSPDPAAECKKMDAVIAERGIDIMLVGIGMNGHIGFNEPGTSFLSLCHVAALDDTTKSVGQKYFNEQMELSKGITTGLGQLLTASTVLLMANGSKKAPVIQKAVEGPVKESFPASIIQRHPNAVILTDKEAAALLNTSR